MFPLLSGPLRAFLKHIRFSLYRNQRIRLHEGEQSLFSSSIVLYDHACPLCRTEMLRLKQRDSHERLILLDINSDEFDEQVWGVSRAEASRALHVLTPQDRWLIGMPANRHVYARVGLGWLMAPSGWPLLSRLADVFYGYIAPNRLRVSRWLGLKTTSAVCRDEVCTYPRR